MGSGVPAGAYGKGTLKVLPLSFSLLRLLHRMKPSDPPLLVACLVTTLSSYYAQQVPHCLPSSRDPTRFFCNPSSLREFPTCFPTETKSIFVYSTQISSVGADALHGLPNLQFLHLSKNNQLKTLPSGLFRNLPRLHYLDLSRNLLKDLPPNIFTNTSSLTFLDLRENQLAKLRPSWFETLGGLIYLRLDNNQLKRIPTSCFSKLNQLLSLDLSSNLLRHLSRKMFRGLNSLTSISLDNNPIRSIAPNTFRDLSKLGEIYLTKTSLTHIPSRLFQPLSRLAKVDLSANKITSLDSPLASVYFRFRLDLSGNPWACDCRLQRFFNWTRKYGVELSNKEDVVCASPLNLKGQVATSLDRSQLYAC